MADCDKKPKPKEVKPSKPSKLTDKEKMRIIESQDKPLINESKLDNDDPDLEIFDIEPCKPKPAPKEAKPS